MYQQTDTGKSENEIVRKVQIVRKVKMVRKSNDEKSQIVRKVTIVKGQIGIKAK